MYTGTAGVGMFMHREANKNAENPDVYIGNKGQSYHGTTVIEAMPIDSTITEYHVNDPDTHMKYPPHMRTTRTQVGCLCGPTTFTLETAPETLLGYPHPDGGTMRVANCELAPLPLKNLQLGLWILNFETMLYEDSGVTREGPLIFKEPSVNTIETTSWAGRADKVEPVSYDFLPLGSRHIQSSLHNRTFADKVSIEILLNFLANGEVAEAERRRLQAKRTPEEKAAGQQASAM